MIQEYFPDFMRAGAKAAKGAAVSLLLSAGILVDVFAGFGGGSIASERAHGRPVNIAINHWPKAIEYHERNHPLPTKHLTSDIREVDPEEACDGFPVFHAHFSPDCRHFSGAKGSAPVSDSVRALPWVVVKWAKAVRPTLITVENVQEYLTWGPTLPYLINGRKQYFEDGTEKRMPDPARKGQTFRRWVAKLKALGYKIAWKVVDAADFGPPTHRKRLFIVARCDGGEVEWPAETHGSTKARAANSKLLPYRTAAECIDFSRPCPTIFMTKLQARKYKLATGIQCRRPLLKKSLWRIANGLRRFVIESKKPFLISTAYSKSTGRGKYVYPTDEPVRTIMGTNDKALVGPTLAKFYSTGAQNGQPVDRPLDTVTPVERFALIAASMVSVNHGNPKGEMRGQELDKPMGAVTAKHGRGVVAAALVEVQNAGNALGARDVGRPMPVVMANPKGGGWALAMAHLAHYHMEKGKETRGSKLTEPMPTQHTSNCIGLVSAFVTKFYGTAIGHSMLKPLATATAGAGGGHLGAVHAFLSQGVDEAALAGFWRVYAFLVKQLGKDAPLPLVECEGALYLITDVGLRMLEPRELLNAQFGPELAKKYVLPSNKALAVKLIGNSVSPPVLEAIIRAQKMPRNYKFKPEQLLHTKRAA